MAGTDYWQDAKRLDKDEASRMIEAVVAARNRLRYSNADLYAEVAVFHGEHNERYRDFIERQPRREIDIPEDRRDFSDVCTQEMKDIKHKGTKKTIPGYLSWLCKNDPEEAKRFYKSIGFPFRPYLESAPNPTGSSPVTSTGAAA